MIRAVLLFATTLVLGGCVAPAGDLSFPRDDSRKIPSPVGGHMVACIRDPDDPMCTKKQDVPVEVKE